MAGPLNMSNNKITHLANPTADKDAVSRIYGDGRYDKKGGDTMTGNLTVGDNYITGLNSKQTDYDTNQPNLRQEIIDWKNVKWEDRTDNKFYKAYEQWTIYDGYATPFYFMKQIQLFRLLMNDKDYATINAFQVLTNKSRQAPPSESQTSNKYFNLFGMTATNMENPTDATDGVNLRTLDKYNMKPSDHTNRFAYLMDPTNGLLQWTDLLTNSIALNSIGDLNATSGNYHTYNKKVIYASIRKNSQGGYKWRLAIQCYRLQKDKDYTLCLEILTTDYELWHKSITTFDTTTSQGVTVKNWHVNKYSHEYRTSSNRVEYMYYHKLLVIFSKTASSTPYFLHIQDVMAQSGIDLNTYPTNFNKYYLIAYGILGETMDLDPNKTYDYHKTFDIKPTEVVYNVNLDMNRKKILNIAPDRTKNNSAAQLQDGQGFEDKIEPLYKK